MLYRGLKGKIHYLLQSHAWIRERRQKSAGILWYLTRDMDWTDGSISLSKRGLVNLCEDFATADRYWRDITRAHKELRGSDYDDKTKYEQAKQIELGYEAGYPLKLKNL